jgi:hypothetical protein
LTKVVSLAIVPESAQSLCGTCIRCSLTQRPRTRSSEHQGHLFRICFLRHRGTLLQDDIMSQALLRLRLFRGVLTTERKQSRTRLHFCICDFICLRSAVGSPKMTPRYDSCSLEIYVRYRSNIDTDVLTPFL